MKDVSRAALLKPRKKQLQSRWTGASQWPSASLTHPRGWEIVFYGEELPRRPQRRSLPILAVEPAALPALPALLPLGPRARQSIKESTPVRGPTWSFSFYCPSQCLLSAPGPMVASPPDTVMLACTLAWYLVPSRHLFRAGPGSMDSVGCSPYLAS